MAAAIYLAPPSHSIARPGPVSLPLAGPRFVHTRWKGAGTEGLWAPPQLQLPQTGAYWVSAGAPARVKRYSPKEFHELAEASGLDLIANYRSKYKMGAQPVRLLENEYAKTLLRVGPSKPDATGVLLNLPAEFVLRYPTLLQLNFRGQPIAGIPVFVNGKRIGLTNGAGQIPLGEASGPLRVQASVVRAYPDHTTADWEVFTATLTLPPLEQR